MQAPCDLHDPCLFFKINSDGKRIYFCIHVDDFAIAASHTELITELCDFLKEKYTITETDNLESFLGIHIIKDQERLYLSQPGHMAKCAREAGITAATNRPTFQCHHLSLMRSKTNRHQATKGNTPPFWACSSSYFAQDLTLPKR